MKNVLLFVWEIVQIAIVAMVIVLPIRYFVFQPFFVRGESMEPNFQNGDYLIIDELSYRIREPQRGEVIVFKYPNDTSQRYIKRIIGLPGETIEIEDGQVVVLDQAGEKTLEEGYLSAGTYTLGEIKKTLSADEYFVLGDNRFFSSDSRRWGTVPEKDIIGRVLLRAWPPTAMAKIETPQY
jgi:signal peptidase I